MPFPSLPTQVEKVITDVIDRAGIGGVEPFRRMVSRIVINRFGYSTLLRPRQFSLVSDYTSWLSLTDRTWSGRHLPPSTPDYQASLPPEADVVSLFRRGEQMIPSKDTSVMFMFFAQWFTDSFLATDPTDFRKNQSTQDIDMCQIYGRSIEQTNLLRSMEGGRLKSQQIKGEEYPVYLFEKRASNADPFVIKAEFDGLFDPDFLMNVILRSAPEQQKEHFFAVGLAHGNSTIGNTIMNIVMLREHNRLAGILAEQNSGWDDERIFQTARNITIVMLLKLVVEEYITHIGPFDFPVEAVPFIADEERWNRTNWYAIEFNLLYRWHPLVPDTIGTGAGAYPSSKFRNNNPLVLEEGIEALMTKCSGELAGKIGLFNTPRFLVDQQGPWPSVEQVSVDMSRQARLQSYNEYRKAYGLKPMTKWSQLTSDTDVTARLEALYGDINKLEWYVGIFAEEYPDYMMMGELLTYMVANDAFTQALDNPLLSRNVYKPETFTQTGLDIITATNSVQDIVKRNAADPDAVRVSFEVSG
jgi:prostaglandin-endoperoxide synthase 2